MILTFLTRHLQIIKIALKYEQLHRRGLGVQHCHLQLHHGQRVAEFEGTRGVRRVTKIEGTRGWDA